MKALITFFILAFSISAQAQTTAAKINHIRKVFTGINSDNTLKKVVIDDDALAKYRPDDEAPDGGEELTGYFRKDMLVKVVYSIGLSVRDITCEYYFEKGNPVFIFEKQQYFPVNDKTGEMDHTKLVPGFEGRYYVDGKSIIQKIEKGPLRGDKGKGIALLSSDIPKYIKLLQKVYLEKKAK